MNRYIRYILLLFLISVKVPAEALILYSSDGGASWIREESSTLSNLNDVAISITTGIAISVGDNGTILRRGDDGTWSDVSPGGFTADLYSVAVGVSGMMACGEGGILLSSFDGGTSWRILDNFQYSSIDLYSVNFDPTHPNSFLIVGEDGFIYSSEDGLVETESSSDFVTSCGMLCSGFPEVVLGRNGSVYNIRNEVMFDIGDAVISGATEIVSGGGRYIAVGESGSVFRYSDCQVWDGILHCTGEDLNDVSYLIWGMTVCAVGDNGTMLISEDNGLTWGISDTGTSRDLNAVAGNGAGIACIVGSSVMSGMINFFSTSEVSD
ncbi:MAG: hypothetical protein U9P42_04195 [Candidatus Fermentibacteria bacterium]|nr:hypothetical protein [Candidatus Fermentibacteria bacterium]